MCVNLCQSTGLVSIFSIGFASRMNNIRDTEFIIARYPASKVKNEKATFKSGSVRCMTSMIGISNDFLFATKFYLRKIMDRKCYVRDDSSLYSDRDTNNKNPYQRSLLHRSRAHE